MELFHTAFFKKKVFLKKGSYDLERFTLFCKLMSWIFLQNLLLQNEAILKWYFEYQT